MKRSLGVLAAVCGVAMVLSACGGGEESQSAPPESPAASTPSSDPSVSAEETPVETPSESPETPAAEPETDPLGKAGGYDEGWFGEEAALSLIEEVTQALPAEWETVPYTSTLDRSSEEPEIWNTDEYLLNIPRPSPIGLVKPEKCSYAHNFLQTGAIDGTTRGAKVYLETVDEDVRLGITVNGRARGVDPFYTGEGNEFTWFEAMSRCDKVSWFWDQSKPKTNPGKSVAITALRESFLWDMGKATVQDAGNTWILPAVGTKTTTWTEGRGKKRLEKRLIHNVHMGDGALVDVHYDVMTRDYDGKLPKPKVVTEEAFLSVLPTINEIVASYMGDAQ